MTKASGSEGIKVDNDNLNFGGKNFTITLPKIKPNPETDFYVNIWFECPVCGYKAQSSANSKGEPAPLCPACFAKANIPVMKVKE
jgi:rubrerythrin